MSRFDYQELVAAVKEIIEEFGAATTVINPGPTVTDPVEGTVTGSPGVEAETVGVMFEFNEEYRDKYGSFAEQGSMILLMPSTVEPKPGCKILFADDIWFLVTLGTVAPAGFPVLYEAVVRL